MTEDEVRRIAREVVLELRACMNPNHVLCEKCAKDPEGTGKRLREPIYDEIYYEGVKWLDENG